MIENIMKIIFITLQNKARVFMCKQGQQIQLIELFITRFARTTGFFINYTIVNKQL